MGNSVGARCPGLSNDPPARKGIYHRARRREKGHCQRKKRDTYSSSLFFEFMSPRGRMCPNSDQPELTSSRSHFGDRGKVHFRPDRGQNTTIIISSYWRTLAAVDVVGRKQAREGQIAARPLMLECPFTVTSRHKRGVVEGRLLALPKNAWGKYQSILSDIIILIGDIYKSFCCYVYLHVTW